MFYSELFFLEQGSTVDKLRTEMLLILKWWVLYSIFNELLKINQLKTY